MTEPVPSKPHPRGPSLLSWLRQANDQVAGWAASLSWWRLALLFLLIIIAGNLVVETLNLKHDRLVHTASRKDPVVVTIGGPARSTEATVPWQVKLSQAGWVVSRHPPPRAGHGIR